MMVRDLCTSHGRLILESGAKAWRQVVLDRGGQRLALGADSEQVVVERLLHALRDELDGSRAGTIEGVEVRAESRRANAEPASLRRGKFAETTIGYIHIESSEVRAEDGRTHMFVAIDRVSKFTYRWRRRSGRVAQIIPSSLKSSR